MNSLLLPRKVLDSEGTSGSLNSHIFLDFHKFNSYFSFSFIENWKIVFGMRLLQTDFPNVSNLWLIS